MAETNKEEIKWEEVRPNFFKLTKIGDTCEGVYVDRKVVDNKLKAGHKQALYTLLQDSGEVIFIGGRSGNPAILQGLEQAAFGERVRITFAEIKPSKRAGMNDTKIVKVFRTQDRKIFTETLDKYRKKDVSEFELPADFNVNA